MPIEALIKGEGMGGVHISTSMVRHSLSRSRLQIVQLRPLLREVSGLAAGQYFSRPQSGRGHRMQSVTNAGGNPILFLPSLGCRRHLAGRSMHIVIDGRRWRQRWPRSRSMSFAMPGKSTNRLPAILRGWFGEAAGTPGRGERVRIRRNAGVAVMEAIASLRGQGTGPSTVAALSPRGDSPCFRPDLQARPSGTSALSKVRSTSSCW